MRRLLLPLLAALAFPIATKARIKNYWLNIIMLKFENAKGIAINVLKNCII